MTKILGGKSCSTCCYVKVNPDRSMTCQESPPVPHPVIVLMNGQAQVLSVFGFQPPVGPETVCGHWKTQILNG